MSFVTCAFKQITNKAYFKKIFEKSLNKYQINMSRIPLKRQIKHTIENKISGILVELDETLLLKKHKTYFSQ